MLQFTRRFLHLTLSLLLGLLVFTAHAQQADSLAKEVKPYEEQEVRRVYRLAEKLYNEGKVDSVPRVLDIYLKSRRNLRAAGNSLRTDIYRMAALSYIMVDSLERAETNIKKMLAVQWNYRFREGDLLSLRVAVDTLIVTPRLMLGFRLGTTSTSPTVLASYTAIDPGTQADELSESYDNSIGVLLKLGGEYALSKHLFLVGEAGIASHNFHQEMNYSSSAINIRSSSSFSLIHAEFTAMARYYLLVRAPYKPYIQGGASQRLLLNATRSASATVAVGPSVNNFAHSQAVQIMYGFKNTRTVAVFGGGLSRDRKKSRLSLDCSYSLSLGKINKPGFRYASVSGNYQTDNIIYGYYDVAEDLSIKNLAFSLSFMYYLSYKVF